MPLGLPAPSITGGNRGGGRPMYAPRQAPPSSAPQTTTNLPAPPATNAGPVGGVPSQIAPATPAVPIQVSPAQESQWEAQRNAAQQGQEYAKYLQMMGNISGLNMANTIAGNTALQNYNASHFGGNRANIESTYGIDQAMLANQQFGDVDLALRQLGIDRNYANETWGNLQSDITNRRGSANELYEIQQWLSGRNRAHTGTEHSLTTQGVNQNFNRTTRKLRSDNTARGSFTSQGHRDDRADATTDQRLGLAGADLARDRSLDNITAGERTDKNSLTAALNALQHQYNQGLTSYNRDNSGFGVQESNIYNTGQMYGLRGQQLTNEYQEALRNNSHQGFMSWLGSQGANTQARQQHGNTLLNLFGLGYQG